MEVSNAMMIKKDGNLLTVAKTAGSGRETFPEGLSQELGVGKKLYCENVITNNKPLIVPDSRASEEWKDCVDLQEFNLVSYLGVPLRSADGSAMGTVCVLDKNPKEFKDEDVKFLEKVRDELSQALSS